MNATQTATYTNEQIEYANMCLFEDISNARALVACLNDDIAANVVKAEKTNSIGRYINLLDLNESMRDEIELINRQIAWAIVHFDVALDFYLN